HGTKTTETSEQLKSLFSPLIANQLNFNIIQDLQRTQELNDFTYPQWPLEFWQRDRPVAVKKFVTPDLLKTISNVFLRSCDSIIEQRSIELDLNDISWRITLHRLVEFSDQHLFQQIADYNGDDQYNEED